MTSKHTETIAVYLEIKGASRNKGISAPTIAEDQDIPLVSVYRVLRTSKGFYQSNWPQYPQGYYFDGDRFISETEQIVSSAVIANDMTDRATKILSGLEKLTPLQRELAATKLDEVNSKRLYEKFKSIPEGAWMSKPQLIDSVTNATDIIQLKCVLISALLGIEHDMIKPWKINEEKN
jgi:hypothetical protein